ncbi:MAG TPA: hypothetical protein VK814_15910 [Acidobacteriaceae bacterium]|nr:hypothetical protein [Acidobacteriaceae bacterium]
MKTIVRVLFASLLLAAAIPAAHATGKLTQGAPQHNASKSRNEYLRHQKKQQKQWDKQQRHAANKSKNLHSGAKGK